MDKRHLILIPGIFGNELWMPRSFWDVFPNDDLKVWVNYLRLASGTGFKDMELGADGLSPGGKGRTLLGGRYHHPFYGTFVWNESRHFITHSPYTVVFQ
jgi:hypothetical protein